MSSSLDIIPVPCRSDNYAYLLICGETNEIAVVDPSVADPVFDALQKQSGRLVAILNTHHHYDHVGGNKELVERYGDLPVYGHVSDRGRIPNQTHFLEEGDEVRFGAQVGSVSHNPGHT